MKERYPFFRDEEEQSRAVIGESAIEPDLNGHFEKPYAILTQKHLYCKNEQGNFIVEANQLKSAGEKTVLPLPVLGWVIYSLAFLLSALWVILLCSNKTGWTDSTGEVFVLFCIVLAIVLLSLIWVRKRPKITLACLTASSAVSLLNMQSLINGGSYYVEIGGATVSTIQMLGLFNLVLGAVALFLYMKCEQDFAYEVRHSTGIFFFQRKDYPQEELDAFSKAVAEMKGAGA